MHNARVVKDQRNKLSSTGSIIPSNLNFDKPFLIKAMFFLSTLFSYSRASYCKVPLHIVSKTLPLSSLPKNGEFDDLL